MVYLWVVNWLDPLLKDLGILCKLWEKENRETKCIYISTYIFIYIYLFIYENVYEYSCIYSKSGFPDNISTSSAMSSLYQSSCALGYVIEFIPFPNHRFIFIFTNNIWPICQCCCWTNNWWISYGSSWVSESFYLYGDSSSFHGKEMFQYFYVPIFQCFYVSIFFYF